MLKRIVEAITISQQSKLQGIARNQGATFVGNKKEMLIRSISTKILLYLPFREKGLQICLTASFSG